MKAAEQKKMNNPFTSLKYPNFRFYWIGMCISLIGTWMQNIAQPWLAYSLTESAFLLSLVGAVQFTPVIFLSLFAGVFLDRFSNKKILILTQTFFLLITSLLAVLVLTNQIRYWHILLLSFLMGIVNTMDMPARQSFVIQLVKKEHLMNAISLNSLAVNIARVIGPSIAGIIMATLGIAACFIINAISFAAVLIGLFFVKPKVPFKADQVVKKKIFLEITEGLKYSYKHPEILRFLMIVSIVGTFALNYNVLVPLFVKEILNLQETYFGIVMSMMGIGSFLGAIVTATMSKRTPKMKTIMVFPVIISLFLMVTGFSNNYITFGILLGMTGFFFIIFSSSVNTRIQLNLDQAYRGRVMSIYVLVFAGSIPLGNLFSGIVSNYFQARMAYFFSGFIMLLLMMALHIYVYLLERKAQEK